MATEKLTNERLTKKERNKLWNRYMWFNNGCTNFQNFYGNGWAWFCVLCLKNITTRTA